MSPDPQHSYTDCASSLPKSVYNLVSITFQCISKARFTSDLKLCSGTCQEIDFHFHDCDVRAKEWITKLVCKLFIVSTHILLHRLFCCRVEEHRRVPLYTIFINPLNIYEFAVGGRDQFAR